jgi:hypothetical protein
MSYTSTGIIEALDYNLLVWGDNTGSGSMITSNNNLNLLWGPGYGRVGVNQDMTSVTGLPYSTGTDTVGSLSRVTGGPINSYSGTSVTAGQWIGFFSALNKLLYHQVQANVSSVSVPGGTAPTVGKTVSVYASLSSYLASANTSMGSSRVTQALSISGQNALSWVKASTATVQEISFTRFVTWNTADDARWFFNSGGQVRVSVAGATASGDRSSAIVAVLNDFGACYFGYNSNTGFPGNDEAPANTPGLGKGYWNLTSTFQRVGKNQTAGTVYTGTYCELTARVLAFGGTGTENGANGRRMEFTLHIYSDFGTDPAGNSTDNINVNVNFIVDLFDAVGNGSGAVLVKSWANPTAV